MRIGEGFVYTMGNNLHGRLGLGDQNLTHSSVPCLVESLLEQRISKVACGMNNTIAITEAGQVYSWGLGEHGILGTGDAYTRYTPTLVSSFKSNGMQMQAVSCGHKHSVFLSSSNII